MAKKHFGNDEIGISCRSGFTAAPDMTLDWDEVTCKTCRTVKIEAGSLPAAAVQAWLQSRVETNIKMRKRQAQWQREHKDRAEERALTEQRILGALQHDFKVECPEDFTEIKPVASGEPRRWGITLELHVQSKANADTYAVIYVSSYLRLDEKDEDRCDMNWRGVIVESMPPPFGDQELTEVVPADQVVECWKQGAWAAKQRYITERDRQIQEEFDAEVEDLVRSQP